MPPSRRRSRKPVDLLAGPRALKRAWSDLSPEARNGIFVIILFTLGLVSILALAGVAGAAGVYLDQFLGFAAGVTKPLVPVLLVGLGVWMLRAGPGGVRWSSMVGLLLFVLSFTAMWHWQYPPDQAWFAAQQGHGGGALGFFLSFSLQTVLGFWAGLLVLLAVFASACVIVFNASLRAVLQTLGHAASALTQLPSLLRGRKPRALPEPEMTEPTSVLDYETGPQFAKKDTLVGAVNLGEQTPGSMEVLKPRRRTNHIHVPIDVFSNKRFQPTSGDIKANKATIQRTFEQFGIAVEMGEINIGPTVTQYTLKPTEGVKLASITNLHNDLALALAAHPIRIEAPIPGRSLVGIEVPNQKVATVTMREILESQEFKQRKNNLSLALGKDVSGRSYVPSLTSMPHMLIAGATGSGKTVCINVIINSLLFQNSPEELRFIMVDPKRVELPGYNDIPHLLTPVVTDVKKTVNALRWCTAEMERRFGVLASHGKRDIASYNATVDEKMPYIVMIIDELADLMISSGPEVEGLIIRLAQMARAVGIHLILATQRPSTDVITGLIKANITTRIAFSVASQIDSRTILDTPGAEKLLGKGDMLYLSSDLSKPVRLQGVYLGDDEINRVTQYLKESGEPAYESGVVDKPTSGSGNNTSESSSDDDDMFDDAKQVVLQARKASASLLQRRLRVGYARAARLLDLLEAEGIIGPPDGARPRDVLVLAEEPVGMDTTDYDTIEDEV